MKKIRNSPEMYFRKTLYGLSSQAWYQQKLMQSPAMVKYDEAIEDSMDVMRKAIAEDNFEALIAVERAIQKVELERFSHDEEMVAAIQKTQRDLAAGMKDHRQLMAAPEAYRARGYREQDCTGTDKQFPLDTMRKTLRGQAAQVGNFSRNPMLFPIEKEFHILRASLLKRAEYLYEELQVHAFSLPKTP